jgi:hypothetical protein
VVHRLARQLGEGHFFQSGIDPHLAGSSRDNPGSVVVAGNPAPFLIEQGRMKGNPWLDSFNPDDSRRFDIRNTQDQCTEL